MERPLQRWKGRGRKVGEGGVRSTSFRLRRVGRTLLACKIPRPLSCNPQVEVAGGAGAAAGEAGEEGGADEVVGAAAAMPEVCSRLSAPS